MTKTGQQQRGSETASGSNISVRDPSVREKEEAAPKKNEETISGIRRVEAKEEATEEAAAAQIRDREAAPFHGAVRVRDAERRNPRAFVGSLSRSHRSGRPICLRSVREDI